jgi:multidrug efflux pump subunit AcrA (membrane-fusion protein)
LLISLIVLLVTGVLFFAAFQRRTSRTGTATAESAAARLSSSQTLRLKGTTEAVRMRAMITPVLSGQFVATLTLTHLASAGKTVKQGDLIAEFDSQAQLRDFLEKQADFEKLANQVVGEQQKENAARSKDETEIKQAESRLSKAQLEMQKVEIMSRIDAEKAQQEAEEAQATLAQLRETFALKRKAAAASIRILEIQRDRTQQVMQHARADAELLQMHAPLDGIVVLNTIWKEGKMGEVQEGDQLRPGIPFMQVVDPSLMEVRVFANQEDFLKLHVGQSGRVHLDAYPELVFPAKLEEMAPIGRAGDFSSRLRNFTVLFSVAGQDKKLMPDLSAAVDVDLVAHDYPAGQDQ